MKRLLIVLLTIMFVFFTGIAYAGTTITLQWSPNSETSLVGYRVYQDGSQVDEIPCLADDASCCEWNSGDLSVGEHSWYVTAYDAANESGPSNTVTYIVKLGAPAVSIIINLNQ